MERDIGLGAKILDDDLLDLAVLGVDVADRQQGVHALGERLADPDQDAVVNGLRARPGRRSVARRTAGTLSGLAQWAWPRASSRSLVHSA